jgi:hypothetical protein
MKSITKLFRTTALKKPEKLALLSLILGLSLGLILGFLLFENSPSINSSSNLQANTSTSEIKKSLVKDKSSKAERAKIKVQKALESKRITQDQASKLNSKIEEFNKEYPNGVPEEESSVKRKELINWSRENNIPSYYIISLI